MHEANKRIQQNRAKLSRSSLFDRDNLKKSGKTKTHFKKESVSPEQLSAIKKGAAERNRATNRKMFWNLVISLVISVLILVAMVIWFSP